MSYEGKLDEKLTVAMKLASAGFQKDGMETFTTSSFRRYGLGPDSVYHRLLKVYKLQADFVPHGAGQQKRVFRTEDLVRALEEFGA